MPLREPRHAEIIWEDRWPSAAGRKIVFLLDAASRFEVRILCHWVKQSSREHSQRGTRDFETLRIPSSRNPRRRSKYTAQFEAALNAVDDDPLLAPLRIAWLPKERDGMRTARLNDLLWFGDPRDPGTLHQILTYRFHPDRFRILVGEPAPLSSLARRWRETNLPVDDDSLPFADFIMLEAALTLDRAERRLRGARYKVPRFVAESIIRQPSFKNELPKLAQKLELDEKVVRRQVTRTLREIAATHSSFVIDIVAQLIHFLYTLGYGEKLHYERSELIEIAKLAQRYPVVFLPSHKSHLDHLVLQYALYENGLPPNHAAGGINMNFFPVGALLRRAGIFFIRRSFKTDEIYKFVLRRYIDYLIEKRFSLEWYIEGSRSRSGKLLPPRFGLLSYVADAFCRGKSEDVILVPVSIAYDQIQEVGDYATEQRGGAKEKQSFSWLIQTIQKLQARRGDIHINFGKRISLRRELARAIHETHPNIDGHSPLPRRQVEYLGILAAKRINQVTPITPISLVTMAILASGDRALTLEEVTSLVGELLNYVEKRRLPTTGSLDLESEQGVERALEVLIRSHVLSCYTEGAVCVYAIGPDQHLTAAYYRNTIVHFFVHAAIAEVALLGAAMDENPDAQASFRNHALRLRSILPFEFFFDAEQAFLHQLEVELALHDDDWRNVMNASNEINSPAENPVRQLLRKIRPLTAPHVLGPIFEAYRIVGDQLEQLDPAKPFERNPFLTSCQGLGKQYLLQRRIRNPEAISKSLFESGLKLAEKQELLAGSSDLTAQRGAFAAEIRSIVKRIDAIAALSASRQAGFDN